MPIVHHKLISVSDYTRHGYNLRVVCDDCKRVIEASATLLEQQLHRAGQGRQIEAIQRRIRCDGSGTVVLRTEQRS